MQRKADYLAKVLVIGDSGVGKTCLLLRFADNSFTTSHMTTIGIDLKVRVVEIEGKSVKLQIWDTAGQERFRTLTSTYYHGASAVILSFDCTDRVSFTNLQHWLHQIQTHSSETLFKVLIATKVDRPMREVTSDEALALAQSLGIDYFETSAREGTNVEELFHCIGKNVVSRREGEIEEMKGEKVKKETEKRRKKTCWFF